MSASPMFGRARVQAESHRTNARRSPGSHSLCSLHVCRAPDRQARPRGEVDVQFRRAEVDIPPTGSADVQRTFRPPNGVTAL
jgi:hypothetical protein